MQNNNITRIALYHLKLCGPAVASFIENASSVTDLSLQSPVIELSDIVPITTALDRNANLDRLTLTKVKDSILLPILTNLSLSAGTCPLMLGLQETENFQAVLQAASKLEHWGLGIVSIAFSTEYFDAVIAAIPQIQTKRLAFQIICNRAEVAEAKARLLNALKRNFVVRDAAAHFDDDAQGETIDTMDQTNSNRLSFYLNRNAKFAKWVENPALIPKALQPLALKLALEAGHDALYRSVHSMVSEVG